MYLRTGNLKRRNKDSVRVINSESYGEFVRVRRAAVLM